MAQNQRVLKKTKKNKHIICIRPLKIQQNFFYYYGLQLENGGKILEKIDIINKTIVCYKKNNSISLF
jgi:hypothetical protein